MSEDLFDSDDEARLQKNEAERKDKRARELEEIQLVVSSKHGRKFYWRLLTMCHLFETSFTGNNTTFFKEGERNIGLCLMRDLMEANPESFTLMQKEHAESIELERLKTEKEKEEKNVRS